jgi:glyoxylase-like metal-dependent hydrolase (beta-lactamase superfamily II)
MAIGEKTGVTVKQIDSHVWMILLGRICACYLIRDRRIALIDTGYPADVPALVLGLQQIGLAPSDLDALLLTHIHADHAGGAGYLAEQNPALTLYVHRKGSRHLADPSRLNSSIQKVYGPDIQEYGLFRAVRPDLRIQAVTTGDFIDLGKTTLQILETPGHARHHLVFFDRAMNRVYSGDALGSQYSGLPNFPLTPPFDYDPDLSIQSIDLVRAFNPRQICYSHNGPYFLYDLDEHFEKLKQKHVLWIRTVAEILDDDPNETIETAQGLFMEKRPELRKFSEQLFSFKLTVAGIYHYLKRDTGIQGEA